MTTTLLIATYNWPEALRLVLESVFRQTVLPDEIVIADDGSGPETRVLIGEMTAKSPVPIKHVWHEDDGFRLAMIRNKAVAASTGDYILQIDGDCILSSHYVEDHIILSKFGYFSGGKRIDLTEKMTAETILSGKLTYSLLELLRTKKGQRKIKTMLRIPFLMKRYSEYLSSRRKAHTVLGFSFSFWRKDFISGNGYNENMTGWGFEDVDIEYRMGLMGIKHTPIRYGGFVYHLWHKTRDLGLDKDNPNYYEMTSLLDKGIYRVTNGVDKYL